MKCRRVNPDGAHGRASRVTVLRYGGMGGGGWKWEWQFLALLWDYRGDGEIDIAWTYEMSVFDRDVVMATDLKELALSGG